MAGYLPGTPGGGGSASGLVTAHSDVSDAGSGVIISTSERGKLAAIESAADVTDAANVATAGAIMSTLADAKGDLLAGSSDDSLIRVAAGADGHQLVADSAEAGGIKWAAPPVVLVAVCPFGAKSDGLGKFLIANGKSSDADDSTKPKTRHAIGRAGTLIALVYQTKEATSTTVMKVHIDGAVQQSVTLSSINANFGGVEALSVSVSAGSYAEIEWDDSDKPSECTMYFIMEVSP